jgi:hypothetical protein
MKSGLGFVGPPRTILIYFAQLLSDTPKMFFWEDSCVFADMTKTIFGQIIFRPNIQTLENKCCQNGNLRSTPKKFGRKRSKFFKNVFDESFALFIAKPFLLEKKKIKQSPPITLYFTT